MVTVQALASQRPLGISRPPRPHRGLHPRHGDALGPGGGDGPALRHQGGRVEQLLHDAAHAQRLPPLDPVLPRAAVPQGQWRHPRQQQGEPAGPRARGGLAF